MKLALNILSVLAKIAIVIMAIVGVFLTVVMSISTKMFFDHAVEEMEEDEDGADSNEIVSRAAVAAMNDEGFYKNPIINLFGNIGERILRLFVRV